MRRGCIEKDMEGEGDGETDGKQGEDEGNEEVSWSEGKTREEWEQCAGQGGR